MRVAVLGGIAGLATAAIAYALGALLATRLVPIAVRLGSGPALAVRLFPSAAALLAAGALTVPGFFINEPARANERPGAIALLLASGGLLLLGSAVARSWGAWRATRRVLAEWTRTARPIVMANGPAPAFRIAHPFPVVATLGVIRPRLFVARSVLRALTPQELHAVLEHEAAHVRAYDNVKRWLMACAPSLGWPHAALRLERAWEEEAEHEADRASRGALELASALVKTARLAPGGTGLYAHAATFYGGGNVSRRIQELVHGRHPAPCSAPGLRTVALVAVSAAAAGVPLAWPLAHRWAEALIHLP
jgi:Zn-dependent protease with chaperone function